MWPYTNTSNMMFFDAYKIPVEDRIGEEGDGFKLCVFHFHNILLKVDLTFKHSKDYAWNECGESSYSR